MQNIENKEVKFTGFRKDLEIYKGPEDFDGFPTYNLYDPVRAQFFKLSWIEFLIYRLSKPKMNISDIARAVERYSTEEVSAEDVMGFLQQAAVLDLLDRPKSSDDILRFKEKNKNDPMMWLLLHYLYIRLPLLNPDKFLTRTLPYAKMLVSRPALYIYLFCTFFGLIALLLHFDEYIHTFPYFFNLQGAVIYGVTVTFTKILHEFCHAYTAKNYRVRVPTMGIVFMVLFPMLYTDVTDAWKLRKRSQRMAITIAGVAAEMVLAGIALFGWAITPPGYLNSAFFVVSSVTLIRSLIINMNPAMRWDGYYLLCDLWGIDNLRPRSFAVTRWKLREIFLGFDMPSPEEDLSPNLVRGFLFYAVASWIYLLVLYTSIAVFVYYQFAKALGIFLFFVEVAVFIVYPFAWEGSNLYRLRSEFHKNARLIATMSVAGLILAWGILPLPHSISFPGITFPLVQQALYSPKEGIIEKIMIKRGDQVHVGQELITILNPQLEHEISLAKTDLEIVQKELLVADVSKTSISYKAEKETELNEAREELKGLESLKRGMTLRAELNGLVYQFDEKLHPQQAVQQNQIFGKISDTSKIDVMGYIPESLIDNITEGQRVHFVLYSPYRSYPGVIKKISPTKLDTLSYPQLSSLYKGPIPIVNPKTQKPLEEKLEVVGTYYPVLITLEENNPPLPYGKTGEVQGRGRWRSHLWEMIKYVADLGLRQSSL